MVFIVFLYDTITIQVRNEYDKLIEVFMIQEHSMFKKFMSLFFIFLLVTSVSVKADPYNQTQKEGIEPEIATGVSEKQKVKTQDYMISAANPHAVEAGMQMLKKGGTAVDAMIAVQLVLNLVEPQSSGIGGGAFALYFDKLAEKLVVYDGRETAPMSVTPKHFLKEDGTPMDFWDAVMGGKSVGIPGTLKLMEEMHSKYGVLRWKELFEPAIVLAEQGFHVSPRLAKMIAEDKNLSEFPKAKAYFFHPDGKPLQEGDLLKNPEFAKSLKLIAENGSKAFYEGPIADELVRTVRKAVKNPSLITLEDLRSYKVIERPAVCLTYRNLKVCGMDAPTSGGITLLQILGILENFKMSEYDPLSVEAIHLFAEANKLAYADRAKYIADPDFVDVPTEKLLDKDYLAERAKLIKMDKTMGRAKPGAFEHKSANWAIDTSNDLPATSHIVIYDRYGNAISMTTTIESAFGSHLMVGGFLLNNELTDFSFISEKDGQMIANRIEPGKRPRSSMAPTMIFNSTEDFSPYVLIGSPGGSRIINYVAKTIFAIVDWKMDIQEAINLPHYVNRNSDMDLEKGTELEAVKAKLEALGHKVNIKPLTSGLHGIMKTEIGFEGGADPRREGIVDGQ